MIDSEKEYTENEIIKNLPTAQEKACEQIDIEKRKPNRKIVSSKWESYEVQKNLIKL